MADVDPRGAGDGMIAIGKPSPLRLAGFLGTALGALLLGLGSVMTWITIHDPADVHGALDRVYRGLDLWQGKVAIACALVLLVGLMALRGARTRTGEKAIAVVMIVAAVIGFACAFEALLASFSGLAAPGDQVRRGAGIFVAMAGGVLAVLGAVLDLAWAVAPAGGSADDAATSGATD
jgi:hypothetical protein